MPPLEAFVPAVLIGLLLLVMLWFTFGTQRNIRIGNELLRWLQQGLPLVGPRTTMRWLGSTAVELTIADGAAPFREATVVIVLEPRDVGLLWAWARSRGRRDFVIVRANLRRAPRFSLEAGDPGGWTGDIDRPDPGEGLRPIAWPGHGITALAGPGADEALARAAWQRLERASGGVWRLAIQPVVPHLEIHVRPPDIGRVAAGPLLESVRDLAADLSGS